MNITNFRTCFGHLLKADVPCLVWGAPGIGKTQVVKQLAKDHGYNFIYLTLASVEDVGDIVGLQERVTDADGTPISTIHLRPEWFPTQPKNIIFLDEFNRMNKNLIQAMLPFILEKRIHMHLLPADTYLVMAANPPSDDHIVNDISDSALTSRLAHIVLEPTKKEFLDFARETDMSYTTLSFLRENPEMLEDKSESFKLDFVKPRRRLWLDYVDKFYKTNPPEELMFEVIKGMVGITPATKFMNHLKAIKGVRLKADDVLSGYNKATADVVKAASLDMLNLLNDEILSEIKTTKSLSAKQAKALSLYMQDTPIELGYNFIRQLFMLGLDDVNNTIGEDEKLNELYRNKIESIKEKAK